MAGGFGKRLKPPTNKIPKPMLKVRYPYTILLLIILRIHINNFHISVNYKR